MREYVHSIATAGTLLTFICYASSESGYLPPATPSSGPYPPSGWKPEGRQLSLPSPATEPPSPDQQMTNAPEFNVNEPELTTTIADQSDGSPAAKSMNAAPEKPSPSRKQRKPSKQQQPPPQNETSDKENTYEKGQYYILLPDGRLQRITYTTMPLNNQVDKLEAESAPENEDEVENIDANTVEKKTKGYVANVKYQDVEPIKGPIYTYSNAPLVRVY